MNSATYALEEVIESEAFFAPDKNHSPAQTLPPFEGSRTAVVPGSCRSQDNKLSVNWAHDYVQLTKPRILFMILITVGAGAICAPSGVNEWLAVVNSLLGTLFVAASASVFNQVIEKQNDGAMKRTRNRPLPAGRLTSFEASLFGFFSVLFGSGYLALTTNWTATIVAVATWILYVAVYTPMKTASVWNTAVGTLPGAMPVLIGWCAVGGSLLDWHAWAITAIVVLWQFPHFMSIAWLYRNDYQGAGYQMWTTSDGSGQIAGWHATLGAFFLIPVAILSAWPTERWEWISVALIVVIAGQQFLASLRFHAQRDDLTARRLLRSSLLVLPLLLLAVVLNSAF